jgi:hypothetical protein
MRNAVAIRSRGRPSANASQVRRSSSVAGLVELALVFNSLSSAFAAHSNAFPGSGRWRRRIWDLNDA